MLFFCLFAHVHEADAAARELQSTNPVIAGKYVWIRSPRLSQPAAAVACRALNLSLAAVTSPADQAALALVITENTWLGGTKDASNVWSWPNRGIFYPAPCTNFAFGDTMSKAPWLSNEPNNNVGSQGCVRMKSGGGWDDKQCSKSYAYLCQHLDTMPPLAPNACQPPALPPSLPIPFAPSPSPSPSPRPLPPPPLRPTGPPPGQPATVSSRGFQCATQWLHPGDDLTHRALDAGEYLQATLDWMD